ncbi:MAG: polysaccharide biosynthesis protein [Erysipelotrichaceae bacterium]|nr:polysaccharide biosynthesis protein [Erysipelotrichaceae bacterium]
MSKDKQLTFRQMLLMVFDCVSIILASFGSLYLRFNSWNASIYINHMINVIAIIVILNIFIFGINKLYHSLWQFASVVELKNIIVATILCSIVNVVVCELSGNNLPRTCYFIYFLLITMFVGGSRFSYRFLRMMRNERKSKDRLDRVMIIGAGEAGEKVYREILTSDHVNKEVVCFIDDEVSKHHRNIHDVNIVGGRDKIIETARKYNIDEILVAMPSVDRKEIAEILNICKETKCKIKKLPGIYQMVNGEIHLSDFKEVEIKDLLGREQIQVNLDEIMEYVTGKTVMVTGGGGSIGSELCRQIASKNPKQLIIVDIYENNAYDIQLELKHDYPNLKLETLIASVRNTTKVNKLFETYRPDIVYHAAAHKHVPLMEDSPNEAVKNNVFGTLNVVRAADRYGTDKMILISTDKAVNPTNIMGATKRLCEMIIQTYNNRSETDYVAVRFGNVLGSNGSVIPIFKKQIKEGGPVTVTHPDIIRYFMTIPEAVSLVLQAGAYAKGGEIFILDMGEPVKIADMARNLIKLSGYEPNVDIPIVYTGLRPGEKLYEELLMDEEGMQDTPNHLIHIGKPIDIDEDTFLDKLDDLKKAAYAETDDMRALVQELVPTYHYKKEEKIRREVHVSQNESETVNV